MINIPKISHLSYKISIKGKLNKIEKNLIKKLTSLTLKQEKIENEQLMVEFIICNKYQMTEYSKQHLNKDHATDIISIRCEDDPIVLQNEKTILGTIILCPQIIKTADQKNSLSHFCHLIVHGTLHLLGYNHEQPEDIKRMQDKEIHILSKFSITSPY